MTRLYLLVLAALVAVFGALYLVAPGPFAEASGLAPAPEGLTDVRATYGGFQLGFAAFLAWSAAAPERHRAALLATALVVGCVGAGRLFGLLVDGVATRFHLFGLAFEISVTLASLAFLQRVGSEARVA